MTPARYGQVNAVKIINAREALRKAIMAEGTPAIQAAWDRLQPWIDAAGGMPLNMGESE